MRKTKFNTDSLTRLAFTLPAVILYSIFFTYAVFVGFYYSLTDWNGLSRDYNFIGLENYSKLLQNPFFWDSIFTTFKYALMLVVGVMTISLVLALALNSLCILKTLIKSIFFIPTMIGAVTISLIFDQLFYRVIPQFGEWLNIDLLSQSLVGNGSTALVAVVFVNLWQAVAMPTVIFIAGLQTVPEELYESAKLDGASPFQRFKNITFPYLLPTFTVNMVLVIKSGITVFEYVLALTAGGPNRATMVIGLSIYNDAFMNMRFSMANAEAMVLFLVIAVLSFCQIALTNKGGVLE